MYFKMLFCSFIVFSFFNKKIYVSSSKLNVPSVLLPFNHEIPCNFTLKVVDGGCYKWISSGSDIVLLEEIYKNGCSTELKVSAISTSPARHTSIVLAQDLINESTLRCDVIIAEIYRLEIVTTTRELYVEEAPEEFIVRGYDDQGIELEWTLQTLTDRESVVPAQTVLRFMTFKDSPYETPPAISPLEERSKQGYVVLVEGQQTGSARLSVRLNHPAYKNLASASVDLMVIANLLLDPSDVYILPFSTVVYSVFQLTRGHLYPVDISSSQYYFEVVLKDKNVKSSVMVKQPTAAVHVVEPSYLAISVLPHNNPILVIGGYYTFVISVFDKSNNRIHLSSNVRIESSISEKYFNVKEVSTNGSYVSGIAVISGKTNFNAVLSQIEAEDDLLNLDPPLKASQSVTICEPIKVVPPVTFLPWDPVTRPKYEVQFNASGGFGSVAWKSDNPTSARVTTGGLCKLDSFGSYKITAAAVANSDIKDSAKIHILEVFGIDLLEHELEAVVNETLSLNLVAFGFINNEKVPFTKCQKLNIVVSLQEPTFMFSELTPSKFNKSCAVAEVIGKQPGFSNVKMSYSMELKHLLIETTVGAYKLLKAVNPDSGETLLVPGTSRVIVFEGGPLPWISKPFAHYSKVSVDNTEMLKATLLHRSAKSKKTNDLHFVKVFCIGVGEFVVSLTVGNKPSADLRYPKMVISDSKKPLQVEVTVLDSNGRKFDNISSLSLKWEVSDESLGSFLSSTTYTEALQMNGLDFPHRSYQTFVPSEKLGEVGITVEITDKRIINPSSAYLLVRLVEKPLLIPSSLFIYNDINNNMELTITGGSGYFELENYKTSIAECSLNAELQKVFIASISSLDLHVLEHVEVGGVLEAEAIARDNYEIPLPAHNLMNLTPHIKNDIIFASYKGTNAYGNAIYSVTGKSVGESSLRISGRKAGADEGIVYSPFKSIQVFPPLRLLPRNITLLVGASFQIEVTGGPYPQTSIEFHIENKTVGETSYSGVITANVVGKTVLVGQAFSIDPVSGLKNVFSKDFVTVNVIALDDIRIFTPLTNIEVDAVMTLWALGSDEFQSPLSYASVIPPLIFQWSVTDKNVADLSSAFAENGLCETSENFGIVQFRAKRPGSVAVRVSVTPRNASLFADQFVLKTVLTDKVFESLKLIHPDSDTAYILMAPNSETKIVTNRDGSGNLKYQLYNQCQNSNGEVIALYPDGTIRSGMHLGVSALIVSADEGFGIVQSLNVLVEVKRVSYMQTSVNPFMSVLPGETLCKVPTGSKFPLHFSFHDNKGRKFDACNMKLSFRQSRFDLIDILSYSGNSSEVAVRGSGQSVLHIWNEEDHNLHTFLTLSSESSIYASRFSVPVGGHVCLRTPVCGVSGKRGIWLSDSNNFNINSTSGIGTALRIGKASIFYEINSLLLLTSEINITPIKKLMLDLMQTYISNIEGKKYFVGIKLMNEASCKSKQVFSILPFECVLSVPDSPKFQFLLDEVFSVKAVHYDEKGPSLSYINLETYIALHAVVLENNQQEQIISDVLKMQFVPSAVIEKNEVYLTPGSHTSISIKGPLSVTPKDDKSVAAIIEKVDNLESFLTLSGKNFNTGSEESNVTVMLTTSYGQAVKVLVLLKSSGDEMCPKSSLGLFDVFWNIVSQYNHVLISIMCISLTAAFAGLAFSSVFGPGYKQTQHTDVFTSKKDASPYTVRQSPITSNAGLSFSHNSDTTDRRASLLSPNRINLWSDETQPVYGSPKFRSSPKSLYRGSPTYGPS